MPLLDLLQIGHIVLCSECFLLGNGDVRLQLQVVVLDLVIVLHEVLEFLLGLGRLVLQHVGFLLLGLAELVHLRQFLLGLHAEPLGDVEVVVRTLVVHLVRGELLLGSVEPDTHLLLHLLDLIALGFGLLELQLELLLALEVLLLDPLLQAGVEVVVGSQELEVLLFLPVGH